MGQVSFEIADITTCVLAPESYDVVYSRDTILHIHDKPALFKRWVFGKAYACMGKISVNYDLEAKPPQCNWAQTNCSCYPAMWPLTNAALCLQTHVAMYRTIAQCLSSC